MIAPVGRGSKPVRFLPKTHVISVPNTYDAEDIVERYVERLVSQYDGDCYTWESVNATPDLLYKFERYVAACEDKRIIDRRQKQVYAAYASACQLYSDMVRVEMVFQNFLGQLKAAIPGITEEIAWKILAHSFKEGQVCNKDTFDENVRRFGGQF